MSPLQDNNSLTGGAGNDTLDGGTGNDSYFFDTDSILGSDRLIDASGIDTLNFADTTTKAINLNLGTTAAQTVTASNLNLTLTSATAFENAIGGSLNDRLTGNTLNNSLIGVAGNDTLIGGAGADRMVGGTGNDTYYVDNIGDVVIESLNQGIDRVISSISYILPNHIENLTLSGTANINGTGNSLNNRITGNSGNNRLNGGAGNDTLIGGTGNDTLNGGAGRDTLTGGAGADIFVFQFGQSTATAMDRITDFAIGTDKIGLLTQGGAAMNAPVAFTRAANSLTTNINTIVRTYARTLHIGHSTNGDR